MGSGVRWGLARVKPKKISDPFLFFFFFFFFKLMGHYSLSPKPVLGDRHAHGLKQPIDDGATSNTNDRGLATSIAGGNVGKERSNPKFEAGVKDFFFKITSIFKQFC